MKEFSCKHCGVDFQSKKACKSRTPKYCSKSCYGESLKFKKKCLLCDEEIINKHSAAMKHRKYCSKQCQSKARKGTQLSYEWRKAISEARLNSDKCKGINLYNWKGGSENRNKKNKEFYHNRRSAGKIDFVYLNQLLKEQRNSCFYCNESLVNYKAIEHLKPVSKGGTNEWHNLVYSCKSCNSKKKDKDFWQFCIEINNLQLMDSLVQYDAYIKTR
jgi:hypothetical protein